jgi:hypothetical protein
VCAQEQTDDVQRRQRLVAVRSVDTMFVLAILGIFFAGIIIGPIVAIRMSQLIKKVDAVGAGEACKNKAKTGRGVAIFAAILHVLCIMFLIALIAAFRK